MFRRTPHRCTLAPVAAAVFVFLAAFAASPSCSIAQTNGLVAAYSFNEGTGTKVNDVSGNNLTGTINGATWVTGGRFGSALSFNGTTSYIDLGNPTLLKLTGSMTLEAWIQATGNPPDDGQIVAKSSGSAGWQFKTSPDTGPETFGVAVTGSSGPSTQRYSTTVRSLNTWYHVAGVYNAASGTLDIYVNGVLSNGTLRGVVPPAPSDEAVNVNIGRRTGGYYFNGLIDEVRIYNRALSQAEIQTDMNTPVAGNAPPLDTTPPTVSMTAPASGATVSGTATVSASASDNVAVAGVQFLLDGGSLGNEVINPPYSIQWNSATTTPGPHTLAAVARDTSSNQTTSASISVTVQGPPPSQVGQWTAVMNWPIVAVHAALLPTGDVLAWTDYTINEGSEIWRFNTNTFTPKPENDVSLFCAGHSFMADGRLLVSGGILNLTDDLGPRNATIFDPSTESWSQGALMFQGRYYPTNTTLADGRVLVQGGTTTCNSCIADMPEIYDPVANTWTQLAASARMEFKYYPHTFVLPDGRILVAGEDDKAISSLLLDLETQTWSIVDSGVEDGHSSVMYQPGKIMKAGTATSDNPGLPAFPTTFVLDMTQPSPAWQSTAPMAFPRSYLNLTALPDGQVLATGGSTTTDKANFATAVLAAELWNPATKTWTTLSSEQIPREYHSTALLLPDARVLVAGGGRENGRSQPDPKDQMNAEIFSPPYLFKGPRPVITSAPATIQYNAPFSVTTPDFARIGSVSLIALGAVTHAFNENQRFVPLSFVQTSNGLSIQAPLNGNIAPPGPYMLFLVDNTGVPSTAAMVKLQVPGTLAPHITGLSTTSARAGTIITITGTGFGATQGSSAVTFNVAFGAPQTWSNTSIVLPVPADATNGKVVVTVGGVASNGVAFTIPAPAGPLTLVQHAGRDAGTTTTTSLAFAVPNVAGNFIAVAIRASKTGQVFTVTDSKNNAYRKAVQFNETSDQTTIGIFYAENIAAGTNTVTVSASASGILRIAILEYSGVALSNSLDVTAAAQGTSATPNSGTVTTTANGDLLFGLVSTANPTSFSAPAGTTIRESVPGAPNTKLIVEDRIQTAAGAASASATIGGSDNWSAALASFKADNGSGGVSNPSISGLNPISGVVGTSVVISGANFGSSQGSSTVTFNGTLGTPTNWTATSITVPVPSGATTGNVVVTVNSVASNAVLFTVSVPPPSITVINPSSGNIGDSVVISGANFGSPQGSSTVRFNGTLATPTSWTATSITVPVPNGATTGNIVVTVGGVASNGSLFTVLSPGPSISGLSIPSGSVGTPVTITGSNFGASQGSSAVTFNGTLATPTNWTATSITVPVPSGATTGNVVVTVNNVASNGVNFAVVSATSTITLVQHAGLDAGRATSAVVPFASNNTAGNWIGVVVRASSTGQVFTVTDTRGNTYRKALQLDETVDGVSLAIYYAESIAGGANSITVSDTISGLLRIAILEYTGVAPVNSLDASAFGHGTSAAPATPSANTTQNGELLLAAFTTANPATFTAGPNFTIQERVPTSGSKLAVESSVQTVAGAASGSATLGGSDAWGAVLATFVSANSAPPPPISVSVAPQTANVISGGPSQGFTATLQNDLLNKGVNWTLSGAGCAGVACGTLTGVTATTATYSAPASIPSPPTVTLTAVSVGDSSKSASATITVLQGSVGVTVTPKRPAITTFQSIALSAVVVSDTGGAGVNWNSTGGLLSNQTTTSATFSSATPGSFAVTATSKTDPTKSATVTIGVTDLSGVTTYHNNLSRDGANAQEYALTPSTVSSSTFGKLFSCPVDGAVYAQPLWVPNLTIAGGTHNVIFVATQHDSVYAFDADGTACSQFWKASMLDPSHGAASDLSAKPVNPNDLFELGDISGEVGITGTPVIDPVSKTLYVVSKTDESSGYHQRLHALNLADGTERVTPKDITSAITVPGSGDTGDSSSGCTAPSGRVPFCPLRENQRPGLVLSNGLVYVAWASHGDIQPYHGWVIAFDPTTLAVVSAFNASPNGRESGIWMAGAAPAVDSSNNLYLITGNGNFNADSPTPPNTDYGDSFLKLSAGLSVVDWFTPLDESNLDSLDLDLGSGGAAILVDLPPSAPVQRLLVGGGKGTAFAGEMYILNRDNLGHFNSGSNNIVQEFPLGSGIFATAAFWQNRLYIASVGRALSAFDLNPSTSRFNTTPSSQSPSTFGFPGATPSVSASGAANGIVWAIDSSANGKSDTNPGRVAGPAVLHAYDATNLAVELWNSAQGTGNTAGNAVKFTVPTIANGRVFIGTRGNDSTQGAGTVFGQLDVYGLLQN